MIIHILFKNLLNNLFCVLDFISLIITKKLNSVNNYID